MNPLIILLGLFAASKLYKARDAKPGTTDILRDQTGATGQQAIADFERTPGIKFVRVHSADTAHTAFPIDVWEAPSNVKAQAKLGAKFRIAYSTTDPRSFVQWLVASKKGPLRVMRRGSGGLTTAIEKQVPLNG